MLHLGKLIGSMTRGGIRFWSGGCQPDSPCGRATRRVETDRLFLGPWLDSARARLRDFLKTLWEAFGGSAGLVPGANAPPSSSFPFGSKVEANFSRQKQLPASDFRR
jgi:hypothetical protein